MKTERNGRCQFYTGSANIMTNVEATLVGAGWKYFYFHVKNNIFNMEIKLAFFLGTFMPWILWI